jgi:FlaG/FlaF family flagellin (archaellin)
MPGARRDRALSSAVGNTLLIAITVLLAATVSALALGIAVQTLFLGGSSSSSGDAGPPEATFEIRYHGENASVTVTHAGGDTVHPDRLTVRRDGTPVSTAWPEGLVTAGDTGVVETVTAGDEIAVVWTGPDGDRSWVLQTARVPS